ncbi:hypothetical protein BDFB_000666 [Asbolus verrucosus]|uniref:Prothoracicotropic hormone n=1 Tax=Asbolus verrucosus TaxID=1661398 RepID=A0A482W397_ASBVE|nr:hypothetical protein BDFB_000666 [Asbolus verrucosus]
MEMWKEKNFNFLDYDDLANLEENKCLDSEGCQNNFDDMTKRKSKEMEGSALITKTRLAPYYHSTRPIPCSCGIEFRLQDLGRQFYPRYLHSGVCKSDSCGGLYRCTERHYKVRVLKQRDPRIPETKSTMALPEGLRSNWQTELISVTVACECTL